MYNIHNISAHYLYSLKRHFREKSLNSDFWSFLITHSIVYDPADDGPEVDIINYFNQYPNGAYYTRVPR